MQINKEGETSNIKTISRLQKGGEKIPRTNWALNDVHEKLNCKEQQKFYIDKISISAVELGEKAKAVVLLKEGHIR